MVAAIAQAAPRPPPEQRAAPASAPTARRAVRRAPRRAAQAAAAKAPADDPQRRLSSGTAAVVPHAPPPPSSRPTRARSRRASAEPTGKLYSLGAAVPGPLARCAWQRRHGMHQAGHPRATAAGRRQRARRGLAPAAGSCSRTPASAACAGATAPPARPGTLQRASSAERSRSAALGGCTVRMPCRAEASRVPPLLCAAGEPPPAALQLAEHHSAPSRKLLRGAGRPQRLRPQALTAALLQQAGAAPARARRLSAAQPRRGTRVALAFDRGWGTLE